MALVICGECNKEYSDKAAACIHCGCPTTAQGLPETVSCLDCKQEIPFNDDACLYCGLFNSQKHNILAELRPPEPEIVRENTDIYCPVCRAKNAFTAQKRGLSLTRTVFFGLLGGAIGKDKIVMTCLKCGHNWSPS